MKIGLTIAVALAALTTVSCSDTGYYNYKAPYTYDPTDPDYQTVLNVREDKRRFDWYEWEYTNEGETPYYGNDSVIVFPVND